MQPTPGSSSASFKERRYRRFDLQFPVSLRFVADGTPRELDAVSKNVSIGGLLVKTGDQVPLQTPVALVLRVTAPTSGRTIQLHAEGEVVRVDPLRPGVGYEIAVACKKPINEMEGAFPAAS